MRAKDALGRLGEDLAADFLAKQGMTVIERNWRCDAGEIDIIAMDSDVLVICEVKTRSSMAFGHPLEAVTLAKAARLHRLGVRWLASHDLRVRDIRFDVVAIVQPRIGEPTMSHHRSVI